MFYCVRFPYCMVKSSTLFIEFLFILIFQRTLLTVLKNLVRVKIINLTQFLTIGATIRVFGSSRVRCAPFFQLFSDFKISCLCFTISVFFVAWQRAQNRLLLLLFFFILISQRNPVTILMNSVVYRDY